MRVPSALALAAMVLTALCRPAPAGAVDPLEMAFYGMGVAESCGLIDAEVARGFHNEVAWHLARNPLGDEAFRALRFAAALAVDREWYNRGLGGNRTWCRVEGERAVRRFRVQAGPP